MQANLSPIREWSGVTSDQFQREIRPLGQPAVLRGLRREWPLVREGLRSAAAASDYLIRFYSHRPVGVVNVPPSERGRIFYNEQMTGYNFGRSNEDLRAVLSALVKLADQPQAPSIAMQAIAAPEILPGFEAEHPMELAPGVDAKLWIGNSAIVAPHYDLFENLACVAVGRRRFILFPPEQIGNLYVGPIDNTPSGAPVSMVSMVDPDFDRYPAYREALAAAQSAELEPGDAIYIPYMWWHGVEALSPFNVLVNYWWNDHPARSQVHPTTALVAARIAFMDMPPEHRDRWRTMFDHYIFGDGNPMPHLPPHARGVFGDLGGEHIEVIKTMLGRTFTSG